MKIHSLKRRYITPPTFTELYYNYCDFLEHSCVPGRMSEKRAKLLLKEEVENIIAINGVYELFDSEREIAKKLGMDLKNYL